MERFNPLEESNKYINSIKNIINNISVLNFTFNFTVLIIILTSVIFAFITLIPENFKNLFQNIFIQLKNDEGIKKIYLIIMVSLFMFVFTNFVLFANFTTKKTKDLNNILKEDASENDKENKINLILEELNKFIPIFSVTFGISLFLILFLFFKNIKNRNSESNTFSIRYIWIFILFIYLIIISSTVFSTNYIIDSKNTLIQQLQPQQKQEQKKQIQTFKVQNPENNKISKNNTIFT